MVIRLRKGRGHSGFTNRYRISSILGATHWRFWFGLRSHYQSLPTRTRKTSGGFGLVVRDITNRYHAADLGQTLPREAFTNLYLRDDGLTTDPDL